MRKEMDAYRQRSQTLLDEQILRLAAIGKRIEVHFGCPQDIEWCHSDGRFQIVQSRPITTLFPIPESTDPRKPRVYTSIGHTQMMTDAIKPLGISFFESLSQFSLDKAGGRVFADITHDLSSVVGRKRLVMAAGKQDPLIQSAIKELIEDKNFMASLPRGKRNLKGGVFTISSLIETIKIYKKNNPSIIGEILARFEKEVKEIDQQLSKLSGDQVFEFIHNDRVQLLAMSYDPTLLGAIIAGVLVNDSLNKNAEKWLGEKNVTSTLSKSVDHNITTEMGLAEQELPFADKLKQIMNLKNNKIEEVASAYFSTLAWDDKAFQEVYKEAAYVKAIPVYTRFIELGKEDGAIDSRIPTDAILAYIFQVLPLLQHKDFLKTSNEYKMGLFRLFFYGILGKE